MKRFALAVAFAVSLLCTPALVRAGKDLTEGILSDWDWIAWGDKSVMIYGSSLSGQEFFRVRSGGSDALTLNGTGLGIGTTAPASKLDVEGGAAVGATYSGTTAAPTNGLIVEGVVGLGTASPNSGVALTIIPAATTSTGVVINTPASPSADIVEFQINGATVAVIGKSGHVKLRMYMKAAIDTLVPDFLGANIQCIDCTLPYITCTATGTAAGQWAVNFSSANNTRPGCGVGN